MRSLLVANSFLLLVCNVFSYKDSFINETSTIFGLKHGGPIVQKVTIPLSESNGLFWSSNSYLEIFQTEEQLLFVDRLDPAMCFWTDNGELRRYNLTHGKEVISIHPMNGLANQYILGVNNSLYHVTINGKKYRTRYIMDIVGETEKVIKIKTGPKGRLWFTTTTPNKGGSLLRIESTKNVATVDNTFQLPNGFAWTKDSSLFYIVDETQRKVFEYDYNLKTGLINTAKKREVFDANFLLPKGGVPTDIVVDTSGCLWIAISDISQVIQYDPRQKVVRQSISVPPRFLTSLEFGANHLQSLFVGTHGISGSQVSNPDSGAVFAISGTGAKGFRSKNVIDSYIQTDY